MPVHIFNLRNVPEDEADDVRQLLTEHRIDFYETPAGRWGISSPGLWLNDEAQRERVKALIASYQAERATRARAAYDEQKAQGTHPTLWKTLRQSPLRVIGVFAVIGFILYVSIRPFVKLVGF